MFLSVEKIEKYTFGLTFEDFTKSEMVVDAVSRNFEIIGEAANHVSENIKEKHNEFPWKEIIALRNLAIHEYFGIDFDIIWKIIQNDLPVTKSRLLNMIQSKDLDE